MDLLPTLLIALIGLVVGLLLGLLAAGLRGKPPADRPAPARKDSAPAGSVRVWHDRQGLAVETDGKTLRLPGSLSAEQRSRLVRLSGELAAWLGATAPVAAAPQPRAEQPAPAMAPQAGGVALEAGAVDVVATDAVATDAVATGAVSMGAAGKSVAAQIDAILQQKLERSPLAGKAIRLLELPGQGMVVMVGLDKYTDLTQVPDPKVRAVIAETVAEWEKGAGPKGSG